jgi:meckelin
VKDPIRQFADLLSVANISMIIFKERLYGYYVHGRSVHSHAETDLVGMMTNLKKEEQNLCGTRGLLPNSTIQAFEMFASNEFRSQFDMMYLLQVEEDILARTQKDGNLPLISKQTSKIPSEKVMKAYTALNRFLSSVIDNVRASTCILSCLFLDLQFLLLLLFCADSAKL